MVILPGYRLQLLLVPTISKAFDYFTQPNHDHGLHYEVNPLNRGWKIHGHAKAATYFLNASKAPPDLLIS
jgi:hypothetical protein